MTETTTTLQKGKKPRHQLRLPQPYFVVVDDWLEKLGEKSYLLWFKLLAKVDRTDETKDTVKYTQKKLAESLGVTKPTLIKMLKPLYEHGFIDYKEYKCHDNNVAENIIVYEAPQNDEENLMRPLVKIREWENRTNEKFDFTKKGGRKKKEEQPQPEPQEEEVPAEEPKALPEFNEKVAEVVKTEFAYFKDTMESNGADLEVVVKWINTNSKFISENAMCYVIKQLATYPEPVKKTATFITNAMNKASNFHRPVTYVAPVEETRERGTYTDDLGYTRKVPFYNWLES